MTTNNFPQVETWWPDISTDDKLRLARLEQDDIVAKIHHNTQDGGSIAIIGDLIVSPIATTSDASTLSGVRPDLGVNGSWIDINGIQ